MISSTERENYLEAHIKTKIAPKSQILEPEVEDQRLTSIFDEEPEINENDEMENARNQSNLLQIERHNRYIVEFKLKVFIEYLLIHFVYFVIGPFIIVLSPLLGYRRLKNLRFIDFSPFARIQFAHWVAYIVFFILYNHLPNEGIYSVELYMLLQGVIFRCIMIAMKYAYASEVFLKEMKNEYMTLKESFDEQSLPTWRDQGFEIIHKELQTAILNLDIESSLFFFEFLGKVSTPETLNRLKKKYTYEQFKSFRGLAENAYGAISLELGIKSSKFDSGNHARKDGRKMSQTFTAILEDFQTFLKKKKLEKRKLSGYNLCVELTTYGNNKVWPKLPVAIFFSIIRALAPILYRILTSSNVATANPGLEYSILPINFMLFLTNFLIIAISVGDLERQIYILIQLGNLISPRKISSERKIFPTMNIFDPVTLHTWMNVRKIISIYGQRFIQRNTIVIALMASFYGLILLVILCSIFGLTPDKYETITMILLGLETVIMFTLLMRMLAGGAFVNEQFTVHKGILMDILIIIRNLRRFSHLIHGPNPIKLDNKIYIEGIRVLREELGDEDFEKKLNERLDVLCETLEDMLKNLKFEESYYPYKVLGIPINYGILKSIVVGIVSILFAIYQTATGGGTP